MGKGNSRSFAVLRMTNLWGNDRQKSKGDSRGKSRSFAALRMTNLRGNDRQKSKNKGNGNSRFPAGMTDRTAGAKAGAKAGPSLRSG